jgi:hypothetical protein
MQRSLLQCDGMSRRDYEADCGRGSYRWRPRQTEERCPFPLHSKHAGSIDIAAMANSGTLDSVLNGLFYSGVRTCSSGGKLKGREKFDKLGDS